MIYQPHAPVRRGRFISPQGWVIAILIGVPGLWIAIRVFFWLMVHIGRTIGAVIGQ